MLDMKLQKIQNEIWRAQEAVSAVYYKAEKWARIIAEAGIENLSPDERKRLGEVLIEIQETLEPYRN